MTRNSRKFQKQRNNRQNTPNVENKNQRDPEPPSPSKESLNNPFGISFVVPTEFVELPTAGEFYPQSSPLSGVEKVEIKHMTAKEEDLLSTSNEETGGLVFDRLIDSLLVDKSLRSNMFCEEDKAAILLTARITGYGGQYVVSELCPNCGEIAKHEYDLNKREIVHEPFHDLKYSKEDNLYKITLPVSKLKLEMINITKEDKESLEKEKKQKKKHNLNHNSTISFINKVVVSVDGVSDRKLLSSLFEVLPAADASTIKDSYLKAKPTLSTMQEVKCPECGHRDSREVPFSWAFFRTDF